MGSTAESYYRAALERIEDANTLLAQGRHPFAMYTSGLAVECLIRAFRVLKDPSFEERHDLRELWKKTVLADVHEEPSYTQISQARATISILWSNNHRFSSENELKSFLKNSGQDRGIKGDFLKYNSKKLYDAADTFIRLGKIRWRQLNKK